MLIYVITDQNSKQNTEGLEEPVGTASPVSHLKLGSKMAQLVCGLLNLRQSSLNHLVLQRLSLPDT